MDNTTTDRASVVQIDEHNLDKECVRLPSDYLKYATLAADAKRDLDELKNSLAVLEAELSADIRAEPRKYGLEKITETAIASCVLVQPYYQKRVDRVNAAKHRTDIAQAVVGALEHKKRTLTLLVELHGMGYFSSPKISERGREAVNSITMRRLRRRREDD